MRWGASARRREEVRIEYEERDELPEEAASAAGVVRDTEILPRIQTSVRTRRLDEAPLNASTSRPCR